MHGKTIAFAVALAVAGLAAGSAAGANGNGSGSKAAYVVEVDPTTGREIPLTRKSVIDGRAPKSNRVMEEGGGGQAGPKCYRLYTWNTGNGSWAGTWTHYWRPSWCGNGSDVWDIDLGWHFWDQEPLGYCLCSAGNFQHYTYCDRGSVVCAWAKADFTWFWRTLTISDDFDFELTAWGAVYGS